MNCKKSSIPSVNDMGRHELNSFLYDLYGCQGQNTVTADLDLDVADVHRIEVFNSPDGVLIALHKMDNICVIGPVPAHIPDMEFIAATPDDVAKMRGAA